MWPLPSSSRSVIKHKRGHKKFFNEYKVIFMTSLFTRWKKEMPQLKRTYKIQLYRVRFEKSNQNLLQKMYANVFKAFTDTSVAGGRGGGGGWGATFLHMQTSLNLSFFKKKYSINYSGKSSYIFWQQVPKLAWSDKSDQSYKKKRGNMFPR